MPRTCDRIEKAASVCCRAYCWGRKYACHCWRWVYRAGANAIHSEWRTTPYKFRREIALYETHSSGMNEVSAEQWSCRAVWMMTLNGEHDEWCTWWLRVEIRFQHLIKIFFYLFFFANLEFLRNFEETKRSVRPYRSIFRNMRLPRAGFGRCISFLYSLHLFRSYPRHSLQIFLHFNVPHSRPTHTMLQFPIRPDASLIQHLIPTK